MPKNMRGVKLMIMRPWCILWGIRKSWCQWTSNDRTFLNSRSPPSGFCGLQLSGKVNNCSQFFLPLFSLSVSQFAMSCWSVRTFLLWFWRYRHVEKKFLCHFKEMNNESCEGPTAPENWFQTQNECRNELNKARPDSIPLRKLTVNKL